MLGKKSRSGVSGVAIGGRKRLFVIWFFTFFVFLFPFYVMAVIGPMAGVGSVQASVCDAEGTGPGGTTPYLFFLFFFSYASVLVNRQHRGLLWCLLVCSWAVVPALFCREPGWLAPG